MESARASDGELRARPASELRIEEPAVPTVSVVIPCYNAAPYLQEALDSIYAQEGAAFEIIAVDDGSTDETAQILEANPGIGKIIRQKNQGVSAARNCGAAAARGEYLVFLDSDDRLLPNALSRLVDLIRQANASFAYGQAYTIDADGKRASDHVMGYHGPGTNTLKTLCRGNLFQPSAGIIRRDLFEKAGGFSVSEAYGEDWDLLFRLANHAEAAMTMEPVVEYRVHGVSATRNYPKMLEGALGVLSANVKRFGLWHRYPLSCLIGYGKIGFYFSSEFNSKRSDPSSLHMEAAKASVRRHPWLWILILALPILSAAKSALRARRVRRMS